MKYLPLLLFTVSTLFAQRTPLKINGSVVDNPNFTNGANIIYSVVGSVVTATTAQDIRTNDSPTFAGLSIEGNASISGTNSVGYEIVTNKVTVGDGDEVHLFNVAVPQLLQVRKGTSSSPDTTTNPLAKFERTSNLSSTGISGDGAEFATVMQAINSGTTQNGLQVVGVYGAATSSSTNQITSGADDAAALYGAARITGSGTGTAIGAFLSARKDTTTGRANAMELSVRNQTSTEDSYSSTGFQDSSAIWLHGTGLTNVAGGIIFGNPFGPQFKVGVGFVSQVAGGQTGAVSQADIRTDDNSVTFAKVNGNHTDGVDTSGATLSGLPLRVASGQKAGQFDHLSPNTTRGDITVRGASSNGRLSIGRVGDTLTAWPNTDNTVDLVWRKAPQVFELTGSAGESGSTAVNSATVTTSGTTPDASEGGVYTLATGSLTNGVAGTRSAVTPFFFGTASQAIQCRFKTPPALSSNTDGYEIAVGFHDLNSDARPTDGAYVFYTHAEASGAWQGVTADNSSRTVATGGGTVTVVGGTWYDIMVIGTSSSATFFVSNDGGATYTYIGTSSATIPATTSRVFGFDATIRKIGGSVGTTSEIMQVGRFVYWPPAP